METTSPQTISSDQLLSDLCRSEAYRHAVTTPVKVCETHISWVFLAGDFAYKVKKPVKTSFLDYSTLQRREHFCREELRLDQRYAPELYLQVVPITLSGKQLSLDGEGETVDYAVKMHRFPDDALLSRRLSQGMFNIGQLRQLAKSIADFHRRAEPASEASKWGAPETVLRDALDNLRDLESVDLQDDAAAIGVLRDWTNEYFRDHQGLMAQRVANGFIRECHGDLHLDNVIDWRGKMMPFDGIEFSDRFRWIDVLSDAAFLAMDFAARDQLGLSRSFINAYLERTGDHASLSLLRWYLVFRSLVRAKVDAVKFSQQRAGDQALAECRHHVRLAYRFTLPVQPTLWITHGVSGSGKTTGSEVVVQQHGGFRLRSDLERKRHFGIDPWTASSDSAEKLYSDAATLATYGRLRQIARAILQGGDSVIVDATFLKREQRESFRQLADCLGVAFAILDFSADRETLRERIVTRMARGDDVSEADLSVLDAQLESQQPLTTEEGRYITSLPAPQGGLVDGRLPPSGTGTS